MRSNRCDYHGPRILNELKQTQDCEYSRKRRRKELKHLLYWDESHFLQTRSWKDRRKTQYRDKPRGKRYEMTFDKHFWRKQWKLEQYLIDQGIPCRIERLFKKHTWEHTILTERVKLRQVPVYVYHYERVRPENGRKTLQRKEQHQIGFKWTYWDKPLDKPIVKRYKGSITTGYRLVWWSDKDIGIEFILRRIER